MLCDLMLNRFNKQWNIVLSETQIENYVKEVKVDSKVILAETASIRKSVKEGLLDLQKDRM